jgi:hypothetical protein
MDLEFRKLSFLSSLSFLDYVGVVRDCVGAALDNEGDSFNVWEISLSLQFQHMLTYIYISLDFFTCLMDHNSCGRITVFGLVVLFDLVLTPGGSVGFEQSMCSSKQSS